MLFFICLTGAAACDAVHRLLRLPGHLQSHIRVDAALAGPGGLWDGWIHSRVRAKITFFLLALLTNVCRGSLPHFKFVLAGLFGRTSRNRLFYTEIVHHHFFFFFLSAGPAIHVTADATLKSNCVSVAIIYLTFAPLTDSWV